MEKQGNELDGDEDGEEGLRLDDRAEAKEEDDREADEVEVGEVEDGSEFESLAEPILKHMGEFESFEETEDDAKKAEELEEGEDED